VPTPGPDGLYIGPLFETHLHADAERLEVASVLCEYLAMDQTFWAIDYHLFLLGRPSRYYSKILRNVRDAEARVISLLHPSANVFAEGGYTEDVLRTYLQPQGPFKGVGEFGLYRSEYDAITFDGPEMQAVFRVVNEAEGVVMIHPPNPPGGIERWGGRTWTPEDSVALEAALQTYPNTTFLFHSGGPFPFERNILPLMSDYTNVYYTFDVNHMFADAGVSPYFIPEGPEAAKQWVEAVNQVGLDTIIEDNLTRSAPWFQQYPDRILWGTDRAGEWMFDESATALFIELSRKFIAQLPAEVQEDYAFRNALRIFGRYLTPSP